MIIGCCCQFVYTVVSTVYVQDAEHKHNSERSDLQQENTQLRTSLEESVAQVIVCWCVFLKFVIINYTFSC